MNDQIVSEIRNVRRELEAEYGGKPESYMEHLQSAQKKLGRRLVRLRPKPLRRHKVA